MKSRLFGALALLAVSVAAQAETVRMLLSIEGRGDVVIRLYPDKAPKTVAHIEELVGRGFYNGLRFHRAEKNPRPFLVEVGDPRSREGVARDDLGTKGSGQTVPFEESGMDQEEGVVGLVRAESDKNSGDSSFYILLSPARFLNRKYTAFGKVESGLDVLRRVEKGDRIASARIERK